MLELSLCENLVANFAVQACEARLRHLLENFGLGVQPSIRAVFGDDEDCLCVVPCGNHHHSKGGRGFEHQVESSLALLREIHPFIRVFGQLGGNHLGGLFYFFVGLGCLLWGGIGDFFRLVAAVVLAARSQAEGCCQYQKGLHGPQYIPAAIPAPGRLN